MPRTFLTFVCGAAALSGLPLMSGFLSKDEILAHAFGGGGFYLALWAVGIATAAMTAYYTWRMVGMTFFGRERFDAGHVHPHESPTIMTAPLVVLAVLAVFGGLLGLPPVFFGATHAINSWLEPVTAPGTSLLHHGEAHALSHGTEWLLLGLGSIVALGFAHLGFHRYKRGDRATRRSSASATQARGLPRLRPGRVDAIYQRMVVRPVKLLAFLIAVFVDQLVIDGAVNGAAKLGRRLRARRLRAWATAASRATPSGWAPAPRASACSGSSEVWREPILTWLTFLPLLGALLVALMPRTDTTKLRAAALGITGLVAGLGIALFFKFDGAEAPAQFEAQAAWFSLPGDGHRRELPPRSGRISILLVALTAVLMPIVVLSSYGHITERVKEFLVWLLVMETGMLGVFLSLDLVLFYFFWEISLVPLYFHRASGAARRLYATIKFFLYTLAGSLVMLVGVIALIYRLGTTSVPALTEAAAQLPLGTQTWLFLSFALAFAIKVPVLPFHTWLADAHTEAPTSGSVLLAGVLLLKMGTYGLVRFGIGMFPAAALSCSPLFMALGADRHRLRRLPRHGPDRPQATDRLQLGQPPRLRRAWPLRPDPGRYARRRAADGQPRALHRPALPARRHDLRAPPHACTRPLRRDRVASCRSSRSSS